MVRGGVGAPGRTHPPCSLLKGAPIPPIHVRGLIIDAFLLITKS
jgi:hypothetical protein